MGMNDKSIQSEYICIKILNILYGYDLKNMNRILPNYPDLAASYNNLSRIYLDLNNLDNAHFFSQKAVHILRTLFPNGHPNLTIMEKNLAIIEKRLKLGSDPANGAALRGIITAQKLLQSEVLGNS